MISVTSGYALRTLICLAQIPDGRSLPGRELALRTGVPANYLSKLLVVLRNAGVVSTTRGSGGGYRLKESSLKLPLMEIVQTFDGPRASPACLLGPEHSCSDEDPCPAHAAWRPIRELYLSFLHNTTLEDISRHPLRKFQKSFPVLTDV